MLLGGSGSWLIEGGEALVVVGMLLGVLGLRFGYDCSSGSALVA